MKRFGMMIRLKPGTEEDYKRYHAAVWTEVLDKILECNIKNYSIYFKDGVLFSYFEYHGSDLKSEAAPASQEGKFAGTGNAPASTVFADVIFACDKTNVASFSHDGVCGYTAL